jgi:hypothetical protein
MTVHRAPHAFSAALASLLIIVHASIDFKNNYVARQPQPQRRLARVTRVVAIACRRACIHRFVRSVALALCVCLHLAIVIRVLLRLSHASSIACKNTLCVLPVFDLYTALARVCSQALLNPRPKLQLRLAQRVAPGAGDSVSHLSFTSASGSGSSSSTVLAWNFENI